MNAHTFATLWSRSASTVTHDVKPACNSKEYLNKSANAERRAWSRDDAARRTYMEAGCLILECHVLDLSPAGVRLKTDAGGIIPEEFVLHIGGARRSSRACKIVWRQGGEIGARFLSPK
jgi:hypothetical protein